MSTDETITLTPVDLPDDVKGRVDLVCNCGSSFLIAGHNDAGQLGIGPGEKTIPTPIELPVPVDDITTCFNVTIIRSGDTLLACGANRHRRISTADDTPYEVTTPIPLDLPGPVVKVFTDIVIIIVQMTDGSWVGPGQYFEKHGDDHLHVCPAHRQSQYWVDPGHGRVRGQVGRSGVRYDEFRLADVQRVTACSSF